MIRLYSLLPLCPLSPNSPLSLPLLRLFTQTQGQVRWQQGHHDRVQERGLHRQGLGQLAARQQVRRRHARQVMGLEVY